jgi:hypothetical protein
MKISITIVAALLAAGCATSAPASNELAANENACPFGVFPSSGPDYPLAGAGSKVNCQIREQGRRYAEREQRQQANEAVYPEPLSLPPS